VKRCQLIGLAWVNAAPWLASQSTMRAALAAIAAANS
jgi:hypothetical protein